MDKNMKPENIKNENYCSRNDTGYQHSTERSDHTEIDQPNPSIATPGIPEELPVREIR